MHGGKVNATPIVVGPPFINSKRVTSYTSYDWIEEVGPCLA